MSRLARCKVIKVGLEFTHRKWPTGYQHNQAKPTLKLKKEVFLMQTTLPLLFVFNYEDFLTQHIYFKFIHKQRYKVKAFN